MTEIISVIAMGTFVIISAVLFFCLHRRRRRIERNTEPPRELRDASHQLVNEATKLKISTRKISESRDPLREFMGVIRPNQYHRDRRGRAARR